MSYTNLAGVYIRCKEEWYLHAEERSRYVDTLERFLVLYTYEGKVTFFAYSTLIVLSKSGIGLLETTLPIEKIFEIIP